MSILNPLSWFAPQDRQVTINGVKFTIGYGQEGDEPRQRVDMLSIPGISAAIETKANDVSQIPLNLYLRTDSGRVRAGNALDYRLSEQPNRFANASQFWKTVAMQATIGECFISLRGGEMNLLPYGSSIRYTTLAGEVRYAACYSPAELRTLGNTDLNAFVVKEDFAYNEVLHIYTFQDEQGIPTPMRTRFRQVLGLASDLYTYTCNVYNRGGTITGYLSTDQKVNETQKTSTIQAFKALFKSSRTTTAGNDMLMAAVDNGWKFNSINLTPQEMMLLETKGDLQRDFAQIVNVPLWKLGIIKDYHYNTAEAAQREYLQASLNPLLYQIEKEVNAKCITPYERPYLYAEFNRDSLIAIDAQTMATMDDLAVKNGCMSTDEWRERRNLPHAGQDIRQIPVNMNSANFLVESETLKLESLKLDIALKQAQLVTAQKPAPALTLPAPAAPAPADPVAPVKEEEPVDHAALLRSLQVKHLEVVTPESLRNADAMGVTVRAVCNEVEQIHRLPPESLASFADRYAGAAANRLATAEAPAPARELNRLINAANHEALKLAHGITTQVRWVGGANDGQTRSITEAWAGNMRHPPITDGEHDCFLVRNNPRAKPKP